MLKNLLLDEKFKKFVINVIKRSKSTRDAALIIVEQAIPCSLHLNMRITEKFVKMLLQTGMNHNIEQQTVWIGVIEEFINTSVYGKGDQ